MSSILSHAFKCVVGAGVVALTFESAMGNRRNREPSPTKNPDEFCPIYGKMDRGLSEEALNKLRVHPDGKGGVCQRRGPDMKPIPLPPGTHKYVAVRAPDTKELALYVDTPQPGSQGFWSHPLFDPERPRHHSQFFGGNVPVACAGFVNVIPETPLVTSMIDGIDNNSGHIVPPFWALQRLVPELQSEGLLPAEHLNLQDATRVAEFRSRLIREAENGMP